MQIGAFRNEARADCFRWNVVILSVPEWHDILGIRFDRGCFDPSRDALLAFYDDDARASFVCDMQQLR